MGPPGADRTTLEAENPTLCELGIGGILTWVWGMFEVDICKTAFVRRVGKTTLQSLNGELGRLRIGFEYTEAAA